MRKTGFTIVEIVVVILIIGVLASMTTVQLLRAQTVARDRERVDDIDSIAIFLEDAYRNGQPNGVIIPSGDATVSGATSLGYPSTALTTDTNDVQSQAILGGIDASALKSPRKQTMSLASVSSTDNIDRTGTAVTASSSNDQYIYQPLKNDGTVCTVANSSYGSSPNPQTVTAPRLLSECVEFRLFFISESKGIWLSKMSKYNEKNSL
jgi:prepilin-type N-terminal cleavage/methylation domain-containing protein